MTVQKRFLHAAILLLFMLLLSGCATIPNGGYPGDISKLGTPGEIYGTVQVGQGLLVATVHLDKGRSVNLQINEEDVPKGEALYSRVLTIGKFSKVLGSGFTSRKNLYYQKRIWYHGKDVFEIDGDRYLVTWKCNFKNPLTYVVADIYLVTIQALR